MAISEWVRKTILDYFPEKKVELIYSGVDLDFFISQKKDWNYLSKKFDIHFDKPLVIFIGSLNLRKRPDVFIKIAANYPKANFLMIGKGDAGFLKYTENSKNFQYIDKMNREDIAKLFASADVLLFPSLQEPYGLVVVEAMASGLPVVVSASGAFPELVNDGKDGFLVPVDNEEIDNFTRVLDQILFDKNLWQKMSKNAVQNVKRFSWENTAKGYKKILLN